MPSSPPIVAKLTESVQNRHGQTLPWLANEAIFAIVVELIWRGFFPRDAMMPLLRLIAMALLVSCSVTVLAWQAAAEPLDKTLQTLLMVYLLRGLPKSLLKQFPHSLLPKNGIGV